MIRALETNEEDRFLLHYLRGPSAGMRRLREGIARLNSHRGTGLVKLVLILGEPGVGKGHAARVLAAHRRWLQLEDRDDERTLQVRLGAYLDGFQSILLPTMPETLAESELFGYMRGAFTGATSNHKGYFAQGYTDILLDEIGDASLVLQGKLLGVLEDRRFLPVGAGKDDQVDVTARLIAATNRDLQARMAQGAFREDLYWRLAEHPIIVPPLREQPENITGIAASILAELTTDLGGLDTPKTIQLTAEDIRWAQEYRWPGNVRQLKHALKVWLLEKMTVPLRAIVERNLPTRTRAANTSIQPAIQAHLDECLAGGHKAGATLDTLRKEFLRSFEHAVYTWYNDHDLDDEQLNALFPDMKVASLKVKLSQWKGRSR